MHHNPPILSSMAYCQYSYCYWFNLNSKFCRAEISLLMYLYSALSRASLCLAPINTSREVEDKVPVCYRASPNSV